MRRHRPRSKKSRFRLVQVVSALIVIIVGCLLVATKVRADAPNRALANPANSANAKAPPNGKATDAKSERPGSASASANSAAKDATGKRAEAAPAAKLDAKPNDVKNDAKSGEANPDGVKEAPKGGGEKPSPLDDAVLQDESDFPADLSDEEKAAIGTGKVPIHREGAFRSPFANPKFGRPAKVKVGLVISEIRGYNLQTGEFEAEYFLSLTSDKATPEPELVFTNGHEVDCKAIANIPTFRTYRCSGKFVSEVDLRKYPFDTQFLTIDFEDATYGVDTIVYEPDNNRTSLDEGFRLAGYGVASVGAQAYKHLYPPRFDRDDLYISRYHFVLGIDRFATSAAFSVFVPALIIVIISLFGIWVPPDELEVRSNAGAPMLAAAVLFHYSLTQALPATSYLTRADKLMLAVYVSLLINMGSTWLFLLVQEEQIDKVFRAARAWVPPLTAAVMIMGMIL